MNFIIDPANGMRYELFSTNGKNLLKKYVKYVQSGGMLTIWDRGNVVEHIKDFIKSVRVRRERRERERERERDGREREREREQEGFI